MISLVPGNAASMIFESIGDAAIGGRTSQMGKMGIGAEPEHSSLLQRASSYRIKLVCDVIREGDLDCLETTFASLACVSILYPGRSYVRIEPRFSGSFSLLVLYVHVIRRGEGVEVVTFAV